MDTKLRQLERLVEEDHLTLIAYQRELMRSGSLAVTCVPTHRGSATHGVFAVALNDPAPPFRGVWVWNWPVQLEAGIQVYCGADAKYRIDKGAPGIPTCLNCLRSMARWHRLGKPWSRLVFTYGPEPEEATA
jgi:hypothetical protein